MIGNFRTQRIYMKSSEFQAMNDQILVKPESLKSEETTESGIVLATNMNQSVTDRPTSGVVLNTGSKVEDIKKDEFVMWPQTDGIDFEFDDGHHVLLREVSIIGKRIKG